jgi:hypothetical protein
MCVLANHLALLLKASLAASAAGTSTTLTGCTTCTSWDQKAAVTSALSYTEPTGVRDARDADLARAAGQGVPAPTPPSSETLDAERMRGTARVVNELRTFDNNVDALSATVNLSSVLSFDDAIASDASIPVTLSDVTVHFDVPPRAGHYSLADLHAKVCEAYTTKGWVTPANLSGPAVWTEVPHDGCGDAPGTVDFSPSGSAAFDADVAFTPASGSGDGPSLGGSAHIHWERFQSTSVCGSAVGGPSLTSTG